MALALFFALLWSTCEAITPTCYFPDGTPSKDSPCNPESTQSFCCGPDYACLDNHLCKSTTYSAQALGFIRGTCTDQSWKSDQCPQFCLLATNNRAGGNIMFQCNDPQTFCCGGDTCQSGATCMPNANQTVSFSAGTSPFTIIGITLSSTAPQVTSVAAATSQTTPSASASSIAKSSATTTDSRTSSASSMTTSSAVAPSTASAVNSPQASNTSSPSSSDAAKIGAGVGVPVGVLIIAAIAFLIWWRERRLKRHMAELRSRWVPVSHASGQGPSVDQGAIDPSARTTSSLAPYTATNPSYYKSGDNLRSEAAPQELPMQELIHPEQAAQELPGDGRRR